MKDIMKKYKRHKMISNLWILVTSLVLALGINFFVIDWTEMWKNLKTSVLNSELNKKSDIFLESSWNKIVIKNSKNISSLDSISLSLVYNPLNLKIENITPELESLKVTEVTNTDGFSTIIISSSSPLDVSPSEILVSFDAVKTENKTENINVINANFSDSNSESYDLTTSWITF